MVLPVVARVLSRMSRCSASSLRVAVDEMPEVESASLGIWVACGTRHETVELNGMAHMLEHMAFKGTRTRSARAIAEEIENVGGSLNAYTGREITAYHASVLKEDVALGVEMVADILRNSVFDPDELQRERGVILQEIGQALDTPDDLIFDQFQETALPGQPLGRPVLGTADSVEAIGRDHLFAFLARHYTASNMVLSAAGRVEHDEIVELAEKHFGSVPRTLAAGARWKVLGLVAALALSGGGLIGLEVADDGPSGFWWTLVAVKAALLLAAVALFAYVSWWVWPSRLFASRERLPGLQQRFAHVAVALTAVVTAGLILGGVADAFR